MQLKDFEKMSKAELVHELKQLQNQAAVLMQKCKSGDLGTQASEFQIDNFYNFIEHSGEAVYLCDLEGNILMTNSRSSEMLGYTKEEFLTKKVSDLDANYIDLQQQQDYWDQLQSNSLAKLETVHMSKTGVGIPVTLRIGIYETHTQEFILGFAKDISSRKEALQEAHIKEHRFKQLIQLAPFIVEIYDINGLQIEVNQAYEQLWGFPASRTLHNFNVLQSQEVKNSGLRPYIKRAYAGESVSVPEYRFSPRGASEANGFGRARWLKTRIFPLRDTCNKVVNIVIVHQDISKYHLAMESLAESEQRFKNFILQIPFPLCNLSNTNGKINLLNERFIQTFGYSLKDIPNISDWWVKVYPDPSYRNWAMNNWQTSVDAAKKNNTDIKPFTYTVRCKNGDNKQVLISGILIGDDSLITLHDISTQVKAEKELQEHRALLEKRIKERTNNLEEKNRQLERFNDLFVDREFRIKELKEEVKRLKSLK